MRKLIGIAVTVFTVAMTHAATAAESNPFEIPSDPYNRGMIVISLDDAPVGTAPDQSDFLLQVTWFDPVKKKPHLEKLMAGIDGTTFHIAADENGHRFLIGSIGQGEAMILNYFAQDKWGTCYNAGTYHFFVKGGTYNFLGYFNERASRLALDGAIDAGKLPGSTPEDSVPNMLYNQSLNGFMPGENRVADKVRAEALVAQRVGHPVELLTPALTRTDFALSNGMCSDYSDQSDRPDRSKTAPPDASPAAPAPAVDIAAKPASDEVWIPR